MKKVYFDNAATTQTDKDVAATVLEYMTNTFGNPGSVHAFGREARKAVDIAREQVAKLIGAQPNEIFFTSGGTESDNISIKGVAYANRNRGKHIIASAIEHHAVLEPCEALQKEGFDLTILPVDEFGRVDVETLKAAIRPDTILISIMFANNEVGTMQPIAEIGAIARERGIYFHTDAVAADAAMRASKVLVLTAYSLAIDLGSAIGPIIGYLLNSSIDPYAAYWAASLCLLLLSLAWLLPVKEPRLS